MRHRMKAGARGGIVVAAVAALAVLVLAAPVAAAPESRQEVAGSIAEVQVTGVGGVPDTAEAVVLNVTAADAARPGYFSVWSCDGDPPATSNVNYLAGEAVPNAVISEVSFDGTVCIFTYAGTDLIVDLQGWFPPGSDYHSVSPSRLVDTRNSVRIPAHDRLVVPVTGNAGVPPGAAAVAVNLTATEPLGDGYLTAYPCDQAAPDASNVNYVTGQTVPNLVIAKLSAAGELCITSWASSHVIVDVFGWFGSSGFTPTSPTRLVDTRRSGVRVTPSVPLHVPVPAGASAAVVNLTATEPLGDGFLTAYPCDPTPPYASNVNYVTGQTVPNLAITKVGNGEICVYAFAPTHVIVDLFGTFATGYNPIAPLRIYDSRLLGPPVLDEFGFGPLYPGMPTADALDSHAVDPPLRPSCPFDPGSQAAELAPPFDGFAVFSGGALDSITVFGGAVLAGGQGPGSDRNALASALAGAGYTVSRVSEAGFEFITGTSADGDVEALADLSDGVVVAIGTPFVAFCD